MGTDNNVVKVGAGVWWSGTKGGEWRTSIIMSAKKKFNKLKKEKPTAVDA